MGYSLAMKAALITTLDGPAALEIADLPAPQAGEDQFLIRVRAAGVSFPDLLQSRGQYQNRPVLPFVPGGEISGEVVSAPDGAGFAPGDRVIAMTQGGGFAELAVADVGATFPLPGRLTFAQGASIGLNYLTAYFALVERARLAPGESVLVHGAAGGVGTAAIQVAKAFGAERVIGVVSTADKGAVALEAGADQVVPVEGFRDAVSASGGVDIVVDPVGGDRFTDSLRSLAEGGRLIVIGFTGGEIPTVRVNRLLLNNISVVGAGWGAHLQSHPFAATQEWAAILPHIDSGALRPIVGSEHPLSEAAAALIELDERRATGKVVLII